MQLLLWLGVMWLLAFCIGFPLAMAAALWRRRALNDPMLVGAKAQPAWRAVQCLAMLFLGWLHRAFLHACCTFDHFVRRTS